MSSKGSQSLVACVVGLSLEHGESFGRRPGVGKSCLCHRFVHPGFDDYVSNHASLYALHEFDSTVINNDHFLYWGSPIKTFNTTDSAKSVDLRVHVLEHTVLYQDITCQPFNVGTKPDKPDCYVKRITGAMESPGKVSYQSRDEVVFSSEYNAEVYPPGISKLPRGFLVVIDVSQQHSLFERQLKRAEKVLEYLTKHKRKHVIVASKRDEVFTQSLEKVYDLKKKFRTHVVEVSATRNLNIDECFRVLAHKLLKTSVKLSSQVQTYPEAAHISLSEKGSARRSFASFLSKRISDPNDRLEAISSNEEYKECVSIIGKFETDRMFAEHVLQVYNRTINSYAGVEDNPDMREEFLEDFVVQRSDLTIYMSNLREVIASIMGEVNSLEEEREEQENEAIPEDYYDTPRLPPNTPLDDYHVFQRASPALSQQNEDNVYPHIGATGSTEVEEGEVKDTDSYYSDSEGSEGPDYVNYDPRHPMPLPPTEEPQSVPDCESPVYDEAISRQSNEPLSAPPVEHYDDTLLKEPPSTKHSEPPTRSPPPVRSKSPNIMSRAQILGNLLGHPSPDQPSTSEQPTEVSRPSAPVASASTLPEASRKALSPPPTTESVKPKSPQRSIKKQEELLSSQLGHKPVETDKTAPPTTKPKPSRSPAAPRRVDPLAEKPLSIQNRAKDLEGIFKARNPSTDGDNEGKRPVSGPPRSSMSGDKEPSVPAKTPPPVTKRVSSLPRGTSATSLMHTDSEDSNPGTPTGKRRPVRVAPPAPNRQESSPDIPVTPPSDRKQAQAPLPPDRRKSREAPVTPPIDRKRAPAPPPPVSRGSPPTPNSRKLAPAPLPPNRKQFAESPVMPARDVQALSPPVQPTTVSPSTQEQSSGDKPKLQAIRKKINERNKKFQTEDTPELPPTAEPSTAEPPPVSKKPVASHRRKDYELRRLPRVDEPNVPCPQPLEPNVARPQPVLPQLPPEQPVKPYFVSVDIDNLKEEERVKSASPPPLPPRLIPEPLEDDGLPPALPARTKEMLIVEDIPSKKTGKPKDYQNVLKQLVKKESPERSIRSVVSPSRKNKRGKSSSSNSEPVTSPSRTLPLPPSRELPAVPSLSPVPRRSQFLVMKNRPLPLEPFAKLDDDDDEFPEDMHDYEQFDFDRHLPVKQHSAHSATTTSKPVIKEQWSLDASSAHSTTRQPVVDVSQSLNLPSHSSLKKANTFNGKDRTRPPLVTERPLNIPKGIWPDYIDGYVNTEPPPPGYEVEQRPSPPVQTRQLPLTPFEMSTAKQLPAYRPSSDPDYDYPELRSIFRTLPTRGSKAAAERSNIPVPPRFPPAGQKQGSVDREDADDYIHMQTQFHDDSYMNADSPNKGQPTHAMDDMSVYMNLPAPPPVTMSLPPRHQMPPTSNISPTLQQRRPRAATTLEDVHPTMLPELQSSVLPSHSNSFDQNPKFVSPSPTHSQSFDEQGSRFDGDEQDYVNVSVSLPGVGFMQGGGDDSPSIPVCSASKRAPVQTPIIGLPPRNIRRPVNN